ncbi:restriction endonuclease subunit S [Anoxybacillus kestanbolensis]|uniref:restriction endonuclease subunit S n=1 Tax=Anoxybacillus kestanbolensis TaxID=227476 RepID=UPI00208DC37B|nr:restriction endonuclease subunit S [Anoxybacillus kestanbolensis]MCL9970808.1 restriction endonuclease subunit S [Anoxybacillus kestanbolensis]
MSKKKQKSIEELLEEALVPEEEQPYIVPKNWVWTRTGIIHEIVTGATPSKKNNEYYGGNFPFVKPGDLDQEDSVIVASEYLTDKGKEVSRIIPKHSTLVCCIGSIGKTGFNLVECTTNQQINSLIPNKKAIYPKYTYYFSLSSTYQNLLLKSSSSTTVSIINKSKMSKLPFTLPPLNEQKRIVDKIERLFAKIVEAKRLIEEVKESVELRRAAILDRAIRGELVKQSSLDDSADILLEYIKMKRDFLVKQKKIHKEKNLPILGLDELRHNIPENWIWVRLGEVIELISGRDVSVKECNNDGVGVPYIMGASNIMDDTLIIERWITKPSVVGKKGDILLSVKGTVGKVVIQEVEECHLSRQIMGLRPMEGVYGRYLKIFIQTYVQVLKEKSKGVIPGISREDILLAPFPLPPYNEQKRIAEKVDFLLSNLDREKEMVLEVEEKLDLLKQSILSQAFRGELGTNDPNDEHAIELLKEVLKSK